jgi:molybdopterin converting factor small subunit
VICKLAGDLLIVVHYGYSSQKAESGTKMDTVRVIFYTWAAEMLGEGAAAESDVTLELPLPSQETLQGLLEGLATRYPLFGREVYDSALAQLSPKVTLFLNGRSIFSTQAMQTKLKGGDLLAFVPMTEGG